MTHASPVTARSRRPGLRGLVIVALAAPVAVFVGLRALVLLGLMAPVTVFASAWPPAPVERARPTADEIAARVQTVYESTRTFKATFKQTYTLEVQRLQKASTGKVTFEKPGKMSWQYDAPSGNRVVSDGDVIRVYIADDNEMFESPAQRTLYPGALAFLMGNGQLSKDHSLRLLDPTRMKFEGGHVIEGTPRLANPAYEKVLLYVDAQTSEVRRVVLVDAQGNRNRFDFEAPSVNQPTAKGDFELTPPQGTKIIKP